jgi:hypothetical protein
MKIYEEINTLTAELRRESTVNCEVCMILCVLNVTNEIKFLGMQDEMKVNVKNSIYKDESMQGVVERYVY